MRKFGLVLMIAAVMSISAAAQSNIWGVWELTEIRMTGKVAFTMKVTQPSVYIFSQKHFSKIYVATDKPRPVLDDYNKATKGDLVSIFVDGFDAVGGTYELKDGKLTLHPSVAKSPTDMKEGTWTAYAITIKGNTATLTPENSNTGVPKKSITYTLTRVE